MDDQHCPDCGGPLMPWVIQPGIHARQCTDCGQQAGPLVNDAAEMLDELRAELAGTRTDACALAEAIVSLHGEIGQCDICDGGLPCVAIKGAHGALVQYRRRGDNDA